ncbi:thioredoxin-disulfide reductase [Lacrimispora defluvii]|uniref:Thioredoxin reductase n=1 Tax=Lacrimispora defluvii TaxID=2719233 RepID=A0ABX1VZ67_9FIRM|nr:thioredoxin-disulfide reductase [Lacrimispora defluvii]NNJ33157.1 thioredoxin-disulfide reductase [Lacrimispora defluvii]
MNEIYDVVIIGSGPAGLTAAVYGKRAELKMVVIEKEVASGGQILNTYEVDNYPGLPGINGFDLGMKFREHAEKLGADFVTDEVLRIEAADGEFTVVGQEKSYVTKSVIIATGALYRKLSVVGEKELTGMGVSYCATCDGAFFRNKVAAVVGGGDVAIEDAIFLSRMCKKVYLIHRRNELRGAKTLQTQLFNQENVEIIWDTVVEEIEGGDQVESLTIKNSKTEETSRLSVDGVFIAVGINPQSEAFDNLVEMDHGYIKAGEDCETNVPGIFAAGDVRTKQLRQVSTAVSDGANAITSVERYLTRYGK